MSWSETSESRIESIADLQNWLKDSIPSWPDSLVILLNGPMGAGKTQLVRETLKILGSDETASPSFAIHNQYDTSQGIVDHVDLYRLEDDSDLESTGFWDLFSKPSGLIFIEWADRLPLSVYPHHWSLLEVHLGVDDNQGRTIKSRIRK